jgi:hypothetical protein
MWRNPKLIEGVFRELSILGVQIVCAGKDFHFLSRVELSDEKVLQFISLDRKLPDQLPDILTIQFSLEGTAYVTSVDRLNDQGYKFPTKIEKLEAREHIRLESRDLVLGDLLIELRGVGWRRYGRVKDLNTSTLAISIPSPILSINVGTHISVRVYHASEEIINGKYEVQFVRVAQDECILIIKTLILLTSVPAKNKRNLPRRSLSSGPTIEIAWPDESGLVVRAILHDISSVGARVEIVSGPVFVPPVGSILKIRSTNLKVRLSWTGENSWGLDLSMNSRSTLITWLEGFFASEEALMNGSPASLQSRKILGTLLRSGYLTGQKADNFKKRESRETVILQTPSTSKWLRRFGQHEDGHLANHISFLRMTDDSWMIQELGSATEQRGIGHKIIENGIADLFVREEAFSTADTVLIGLYQRQMKFNKNFWTSRAQTLDIPEYLAYVTEYSPPSETERSIPTNPGTSDSEKITLPILSTWKRTYEKLNEFYPSDLLAAAGITSGKFSSPQLTVDVLDSGFVMQRTVALIESCDFDPAVAINYGLPTFANLTISANHLWLILTNLDNLESTLAILASSEFGRSMLHGVTQIVIMTPKTASSLNETEQLPSGIRAFIVLPIPFHLLAKFSQLASREDF